MSGDITIRPVASKADRKAFVEAVEEGARSAAAGKLRSNEEAMKILDSFGK